MLVINKLKLYGNNNDVIIKLKTKIINLQNEIKLNYFHYVSPFIKLYEYFIRHVHVADVSYITVILRI